VRSSWVAVSGGRDGVAAPRLAAVAVLGRCGVGGLGVFNFFLNSTIVSIIIVIKH
jgi:hypothetical protein